MTATRPFACGGFAGTSLDEVAAEAGVSRVILYRRFESKTDLYRAMLDRVCARLVSMVGAADYTPESVDALLTAAAEDPEGFRLLFHHAVREPEFKAGVGRVRAGGVDIARVKRRVAQARRGWRMLAECRVPLAWGTHGLLLLWVTSCTVYGLIVFGRDV